MMNSCAALSAVVLVSCSCTIAQEAPKPASAPAVVAEADKLDTLVESRTPKQIGERFRFTEGPLWDAKNGKLIFSDIGGTTVYAAVPGAEPFTPETAEVLLQDSKQANGNAFDGDGRIVNAGSDRSIVRVDGEQAVAIVRDFEGKRLNSPNDVVVKKDGSVYFTDPPFFAPRDARELDFSGVYRVGADGKLSLLTRQFELPNGLAFSADEKTLYINEHGKREVWAFDVKDDGSIENGRVLIAMKGPQGARGAADGLKVDTQGNIWTTGPGGIWVVSAKGEKLGVIEVQGASNLAFGGADRKTLFVTAGGNLYSIATKVAGL